MIEPKEKRKRKGKRSRKEAAAPPSPPLTATYAEGLQACVSGMWGQLLAPCMQRDAEQRRAASVSSESSMPLSVLQQALTSPQWSRPLCAVDAFYGANFKSPTRNVQSAIPQMNHIERIQADQLASLGSLSIKSDDLPSKQFVDIYMQKKRKEQKEASSPGCLGLY